LASDGLWDGISPEGAYDRISLEKDSKLMSHILIKEAKKISKDNITTVVVKL